MITVVSNTSPLMYLITLDEHNLLRQLFSRIFIPQAVFGELCAPGAPLIVRQVMSKTPFWISVTSEYPYSGDNWRP
jgi:predicted nucleic acid-binding protein